MCCQGECFVRGVPVLAYHWTLCADATHDAASGHTVKRVCPVYSHAQDLALHIVTFHRKFSNTRREKLYTISKAVKFVARRPLFVQRTHAIFQTRNRVHLCRSISFPPNTTDLFCILGSCCAFPGCGQKLLDFLVQ